MPDDFYSPTETDWQETSGPYINRAFDASADLWPHGPDSEILTGDKDVLEDGLHPVLAIGPQDGANRADQETGSVVTYNAANDRAEVNIAPGHALLSYVANITDYVPTYAATYNIGDPVYVDDSSELSAGVTLSLSPKNNQDTDNPQFGILWYGQTEYDDSGVAGAGASTSWPKTANDSALVESLLTVMKT